MQVAADAVTWILVMQYRWDYMKYNLLIEVLFNIVGSLLQLPLYLLMVVECIGQCMPL